MSNTLQKMARVMVGAMRIVRVKVHLRNLSVEKTWHHIFHGVCDWIVLSVCAHSQILFHLYGGRNCVIREEDQTIKEEDERLIS